MKLVTPRFLLRDFAEPDRRPFIDYQMDPRYRRLYEFNDDEARANELFDRFGAWRQQEPRQNLQVGIFDAKNSRLCGCAGLRKEYRSQGTAVLGIELTPDDWGRYGLAIEVASALIEYGFHTLDLDTIIGDTASGNSRVEKLARWFGARIIASRDGPDWMQARGWKEVDWSLSRDAWAASPGRRRLLRTERPSKLRRTGARP